MKIYQRHGHIYENIRQQLPVATLLLIMILNHSTELCRSGSYVLDPEVASNFKGSSCGSTNLLDISWCIPNFIATIHGLKQPTSFVGHHEWHDSGAVTRCPDHPTRPGLLLNTPGKCILACLPIHAREERTKLKCEKKNT